MDEQIKPFQRFQLVYDPQYQQPWFVVCIATGEVVEAFGGEEAARGVLRMRNAQGLPMGVQVRHVHSHQLALFVGIGGSVAYVWTPFAPFISTWGLSYVELV